MKRISLIAFCVAMMAAVACGGNSGKGGKAVESGDTEQMVEAADEATAPVAEKQEQKVEPKKWYEGDFTLTEKMYVGSASTTRIYARKGNIVIGTAEGSPSTTLFVCTDSTRTQYLVANEKGTYAKVGEKSGFDSVDEAIYKYLKDQMSNTLFGKTLKKGDEGVTVKDTTIFGRPAYVMTKEVTEKNVVAEVWGKTIMYMDKENGLPYYKWAIVKNTGNGNVITEGKVFEVTAFSADPTYEGLIVSLDGLTGIQ